MFILTYPEGATPLDSDEINGLKFKHITTRTELDHLEQANIENGLRWIDRSKNKDILTEDYIRKLHKKLFGDVWRWAGTFRLTEKNIGVDPFQISVQLRMLLDDVKYWIEYQTFSPKEIAIRFHHRLVKIHLFPNGNGRHARIMADAVLSKLFSLPPLDWASNEGLVNIGARRSLYIKALREADKNDYNYLYNLLI